MFVEGSGPEFGGSPDSGSQGKRKRKAPVRADEIESDVMPWVRHAIS